MTSAKAIKEAAAIITSPFDNTIECYVFNPDEMQAFEEAICREQRELCADSITLGKPMKETILTAPKPTTV